MDNTETTSQPEPAKTSSSKTITIVVVVVLLIALGVGGYMFLGKKDAQTPSQATTANAQPSPTSGSVISSLKEALAGSASLQCDYTDETGRTTTSYMKNGAVRTDIAASGSQLASSMIMKDKKMYFWTGKEGTMMEFDLQAMMDGVTPPVQTTPAVKQDPQDFIESLERYKQSCKQTNVDDALFTPPTDVKFTDLSAMMQGIKTMPSGGMSEEQIKALQQQYQQ